MFHQPIHTPRRAAIFVAARDRISNGQIEPRLFLAQDWTPGPNYGRSRPQTFGERRAAYASVMEVARRIEEGRAYNALRSRIIAETPACQSLIAQMQALDNLPFGVRLSDDAAPLKVQLEAIIAGRVAEALTERETEAGK